MPDEAVTWGWRGMEVWWERWHRGRGGPLRWLQGGVGWWRWSGVPRGALFPSARLAVQRSVYLIVAVVTQVLWRWSDRAGKCNQDGATRRAIPNGAWTGVGREGERIEELGRGVRGGTCMDPGFTGCGFGRTAEWPCEEAGRNRVVCT